MHFGIQHRGWAGGCRPSGSIRVPIPLAIGGGMLSKWFRDGLGH